MNPILDKLKNLVLGGGATFVEKIGKALDDNITNKEELLKATAEVEKVKNEHIEAIANIALEEAKLEVQKELAYLQDVANARQMQIEALKQGDNFSKRFLYYLAGFMIVSAFTFGIFLVFYPIPEANKRMVEMFVDVFLFAGAFMVLQFFFGSSMGSKNNGDAVRKMLDK